MFIIVFIKIKMNFVLEDPVSEEMQFIVCGEINDWDHHLPQEKQEIFKPEDNTENSHSESESIKEKTNAEMLISWDHRLSLMARTKTIKKQLWLEVLSGFGGNTDLSKEILQKKWKNLRDKFIKTKAEVDTYMPLGSESKKKTKFWKHFHSMAFIRDTVAPRGAVSSWSPANSVGVKVVVSSPSGSNES